jgi:hypothetical protein
MVRTRRRGDNLRGDFIDDLRHDRQFPGGIRRWRDVESYLFSCHACDKAMEAARCCGANTNKTQSARHRRRADVANQRAQD